MKMHDLEQRVINALHQEHAAETLRAWIGGEGMPNRLLADLVSRLHPDDDAILRLVLERERRLASTPALPSSGPRWRNSPPPRSYNPATPSHTS